MPNVVGGFLALEFTFHQQKTNSIESFLSGHEQASFFQCKKNKGWGHQIWQVPNLGRYLDQVNRGR